MALGRFLVFGLALAACSSTTIGSSTTVEFPLVVSNHGGSLEGHTPRGFAGMGTGLFTGDNLNPSFPEGDGVHIFLTFELPGPVTEATSVVLASDALVVRGSPFEDLGPLTAEVVAYDAFGPDLFDAPSLSARSECSRVGTAGLQCDLGNIVLPPLTEGDTVVQLRLAFEQAADDDGAQDLAMFFRSDSNTNEPGLFTLTFDR